MEWTLSRYQYLRGISAAGLLAQFDIGLGKCII